MKEYMEETQVFYCNGKAHSIKELEKGMRVLGSTMPYSGKHEGYFGIWEGIVISEDHNDVYDVIIKCDDGVVRNAVDKFMRGSVIIEKI